MGLALEVVSGRVTNSATLIAATAGQGDSFTVRSFGFEAGAFLENAWGGSVANRVLRIRSPRMHDNVENLRFQLGVALPEPLFPEGAAERLFPTDALSVFTASGAADTTAVSLLVYYNSLPGIDARLAQWEEIAPRIAHILTAENVLTGSATAGEYGGSQAIVADFDLLKANTDYAVLGYTSDVAVDTVGITSPDFGNLRVGGPGSTARVNTRDWFKRLSLMTGRPHIPVFNSNNRDSTLVDIFHHVASLAVTVEVFMAELSG